jgi:hypothetical protein
MPSKITKHERRLIDEAIARGETQKIERGRSAFNYKWDGTRIVLDEENSAGKTVYNKGYHPKITDTVVRRRQLVKEYHEEGLSLKLMTERLQAAGWDILPRRIKSDLKVLKLTPIHHDEYINNERLQLFWKYFNDGVHRHKDLAALMDLSESTLQKFLTKNGLRLSSLRTAPAGSQRTEPRKSGSDPE